jgi:hypothetical protein
VPRSQPTALATRPDPARSWLGAPVGEPVALVPPPPSRRLLAGAVILVGLKLAAFAFWLRRDPAEGIPILLALAGALALDAFGAGFFFRTLLRGKLSLYANGLTIGPEGSERTVLYSDVRSLTIRERESVEKGSFAGTVVRRITLRADGETAGETLRFGHRAVDGQPDPVTPALRTFLLRLADAVEKRLDEGGALAGAGWALTSRHFRPKRRALPVPLSEIHRIALLQGSVRLWRRGRERPFAAVPARSRNAHLLLELVTRRIAAPFSSPSRVSVLGPFLFSLPAGLMGHIEVHADGLAEIGLHGHRELLFADVERMRLSRWSNTVTYTAGAGSRTRFRVRFRPGLESNRLFLLRPASCLADRMAQQLRGEGTVPWMRGVHLTPEGILVERRRWNGRRESRFVSLADRPTLRLKRGVLRVAPRGKPEAGIVLKASRWGFYPGLILLESLLKAR